jgi:hypothetical protein
MLFRATGYDQSELERAFAEYAEAHGNDVALETLERSDKGAAKELDVGEAYCAVGISNSAADLGNRVLTLSYCGSMPALTMASCQRLIWLTTRSFISDPRV